ncbi:MAG: radical SAM family heme chaperone HemW [Woeseiaceae bacterium]|nr:radical SAM family heme chaperone HemW [Woeseiaceae bacterium]
MSPPLSLYVHLPWCVKKCPYCDFNSHTAGATVPHDRYIDALRRDLAGEADRAGDRPLASVFLGGGTPSLFSGAAIGRVLDAVRAGFAVAAEAEVTMEANPGTVERHNLAGYREAGVNRLSLGAQSFDSRALARLGRIHGPDEIVAAVADARRAGFDNLNLDLMFALPGQRREDARRDLDRALALAPEHLSLYQLTLEPNTVFARRPPADLPGDELAWDMQMDAFARLQASGYRRYEISAFARPGRECRHNRNYWTFGDYAAVGAGAHGKLTSADGTVRRYAKPAHPLAYMEAAERGALQPGSLQVVEAADRVFEFMLNALRLPEGFSMALFESRTGLPESVLRAPMASAAADGLVTRRGDGGWQPSGLGLQFLNDLQARFLPVATAAAGDR